jgi:pimeloyl-ACP methyl ester carboxylesterase
MKQRVIFFSGLAADERAFSLLNLENISPVYVNWIEPDKDEELHQYAMRLVKDVQISQDDVLLGLSFGGLIAQEIASEIAVKKVILLSSLRSGETLRPLFTAAQKLHLLDLLNTNLLKSTITNGAKILLPQKDKIVKVLVEMMDDFSGEYYKWAMNQVLHWNGANVNCPVYHLHGDKDEIFPVSLVKDAVIVKGGRHLMVAVRAAEVSQIIRDFIFDRP